MFILSEFGRFWELILLQPIADVIKTIQAAVYYFFWASYLIGFCLVQSGVYVWRFICGCIATIGLINHQLLNFYQELCQFIHDIKHAVEQGAANTVDLLNHILNVVAQHFYSCLFTIQLWTNAAGGQLYILATIPLKILIGLGNFALWLLLLLPRAIVVIFDQLLLQMSSLVNFLVTRGTEALNNLFCLSIGIVLILVLYMFRYYLCLIVVYALRRLQRKTTAQLQAICQWFKQTCSRPAPVEYVSDAALDRPTCVICLERSKCIVVLPCRHLCLCKECAQVLHGVYVDRRCPICRHDIESMLTVYV